MQIVHPNPARYHMRATLAPNWTVGLFCPISPSPLKIKLQRIKHLEAEIADMQKEIDKLKQKAAAREERIQRQKKELGFSD